MPKDHEFQLSDAELEQLPDLDPDALCKICGENSEAHRAEADS